MDDGASVDLVDVSSIDGPDRLQVTVKQLWRTEQPHSDAENENSGDVVDDSNYRYGSPQWLPHPSRGSRRLKPLTLDTNLLPPFLLSPGYPYTAENVSSPFPYTPDYFDIRGEGLLLPSKFDDDMWFDNCPHLLIHGPDDFDDADACDFHSRFSVLQDAGDDSDASEAPDESTDYITFTGRSAPISPELELGFRQLDLSEPSSFVLDFPEDVGESLEHDPVLAHGDSDAIDQLGPRTPVPASEIPVEMSVRLHGGSQTPSVYPSDILIPRVREPSEDNGKLGSVSRLPCLELDVKGAPLNFPVSPFVTDGFPDDTTPLRSDLAGGEVEGISVDADWLGRSLEEIICSPCLEEELVEWNPWRGQLVEELDRDLSSWAEVRESVRAELGRS